MASPMLGNRHTYMDGGSGTGGLIHFCGVESLPDLKILYLRPRIRSTPSTTAFASLRPTGSAV